LIVLLVLIAGGRVRAEPAQPPLERFYRRCESACVDVLIEGRHSGSGWLADPGGLVVTVAHLFRAREPAVEVMSPSIGRLPAVLVALDRGHDIALLGILRAGRDLPALSAARRAPRVGEELWQFGTPLFRTGLLQSGRVARPGTGFEYYADAEEYAEVAYVAAMMQGGTSGGPWLNQRGEVVGVQSGVMSLEGKPTGLAFVAPAGPVGDLLRTLRNAETPSLGLAVDETWQMDTEWLKKLPPKTEGLVVARVRQNGPAEKAGIKNQDVVLSADGARVRRIADLLRWVRGKRPGTSVTLEVLRPGEPSAQSRQVMLESAEAPLNRTNTGSERSHE